MKKNDIYSFLKKKVLKPKEIAKIVFWNQIRGIQTNPYACRISEYIEGHKPVLDDYELEELIETTTKNEAIQGNIWLRVFKLTRQYDVLACNCFSETIILLNEMTCSMMQLSNQIAFYENVVLTESDVSKKLETYEFFSISLNKSLLLKDFTLEIINRLYSFLLIFQIVLVHQCYSDEAYDEANELFSTAKLIALNKGIASMSGKEHPNNLYNYFIRYYEECVLSVIQITNKDLKDNLKDYFLLFIDSFFPNDYFVRDDLSQVQQYVKGKFLSYFPMIRNQKDL